MSNTYMIIILIVLAIVFVSLVIWGFLNKKNTGKRNMAITPYQSDYEYEGLSKGTVIDIEEDEEDDDEEISFETSTSKEKLTSVQKKKLVKKLAIYGVWLICFISVLLVFIKPSGEQIYIVYAGKYNIANDMGVKLHLSNISEVKEATVLFAPIDEADGISSFDIAGLNVLSKSIENKQVDLLIVDYIIFESLQKELKILDESFVTKSDNQLLIVDGNLYGVEVSNCSELFEDFTCLPEKSYMVIYENSINTKSALKCMEYYINNVE